ncbi:MAG: SurA N-terminal domain-containing protein [Archangium sp.]|nr:SurA N-terminal domain-containing protein [Archangium sp.]
MSNSSENTRRYGSYFFIAALAILFALQWGPGSQGCDTRIVDAETAATVNGKPIPLKDFARSYSQQSENFRRQGVPADLMKQFGIHKQVIDQLVNTELLSQAAEARGLTTSNEDLAKVLKEAPAFQKDGKFNKESYLEYVRQVEGTTEIFFEDKLRRQLAAQKLLELVESSVAVSDEEVKAKYLKEGDVAKVTFVRFSPTMFSEKVGTPKPAEVDAWAKANEAAIAEHYEHNKFTFFQAEKVKAKQILLKVPADADDAKKAEIKSRIENVRKDIVDNKKDFSELAKAVSEDLETREKGGDLGFVERLQLPGAFADMLFALKPGEVTAPVETPMGWFIGTVVEKKAPEQRPLDTVRKEIAGQLFVKEKAKGFAKAEAEKALADVKAGKKLVELFPPAKSEGGMFAMETKPEAKETGSFNSSVEDIPQLGKEPALKKMIFDMKAAGNIEQVLTVGDSLVVAVVDERKSPSDPDFETQKETLKNEAVKGKQFEVREGFLKSLKQVGTVVTNDSAIDKIISDS